MSPKTCTSVCDRVTDLFLFFLTYRLLSEHVTTVSDNGEALSFLSLVEATRERGTFEMNGGLVLSRVEEELVLRSLEVSYSTQGLLHKDYISLCWPEQPTCYWLWLSVWEVTVMFAGVLEVTLRISLFLKAGKDDNTHPAKLPLPYPYVMPLL